MDNTKIPFDFDNEENNESQESTTESMSALSSLENILLKLEHLEGITQVCASAFSFDGALATVNEHDLENTFCTLRDQIKDIEKDAQAIIGAIADHKAHLHY